MYKYLILTFMLIFSACDAKNSSNARCLDDGPCNLLNVQFSAELCPAGKNFEADCAANTCNALKKATCETHDECRGALVKSCYEFDGYKPTGNGCVEFFQCELSVHLEANDVCTPNDCADGQCETNYYCDLSSYFQPCIASEMGECLERTDCYATRIAECNHLDCQETFQCNNQADFDMQTEEMHCTQESCTGENCNYEYLCRDPETFGLHICLNDSDCETGFSCVEQQCLSAL